MKCEICGKGPEDGTTIHRTGKKGPGEDPHWRCEADLPWNRLPDQVVSEVVAVIEQDQNKNVH